MVICIIVGVFRLKEKIGSLICIPDERAPSSGGPDIETRFLKNHLECCSFISLRLRDLSLEMNGIKFK
jgi:hypothetical protein